MFRIVGVRSTVLQFIESSIANQINEDKKKEREEDTVEF